MEIGLYGPSIGLTPEQMGCLRNLLKNIKPSTIHRCNDNGVDYEFHQIVTDNIKSRIIVHPLCDGRVLSGCSHGVSETLSPQNVVVRDQALIDGCELLIVATETQTQKMGSQTWNFARKTTQSGKNLIVINPKGKAERFILNKTKLPGTKL